MYREAQACPELLEAKAFMLTHVYTLKHGHAHMYMYT
jgi:hypothetical protein